VLCRASSAIIADYTAKCRTYQTVAICRNLGTCGYKPHRFRASRISRNATMRERTISQANSCAADVYSSTGSSKNKFLLKCCL
jgi:hypothetical protein